MTTNADVQASSREARAAEPVRGAALSGAKVLVISDEPLQGFGMRALLESLGVAATFAETATRARRMLMGRHEIVVWIADRFDADALAGAETLWTRQPDLGFCLVANAVDARVLRSLLEHDAEHFAFVARRHHPGADDLLHALDRVASGHGVLEGSALRRIFTREDEGGVQLERLSDPEREVLELLAEGLRNCEIALRLWKSEKTVEKHIGRVFEKLELNSTSRPYIDRRVCAARMFLLQASSVD
jgi:DNA-binding NarL/FixJ family response regulator